MSNKNEEKSFWTTVPGILTGIAAIITAIGGLIIALNAAGIFTDTNTPTPTTSTPTPTPTIGSISISSSPSGASIYLDGSYQGITPMTIKSIEVGSYTITLEYTGYQDWSQTIYVVAGETTNVIASPTPYEHSISNIQLDPPSGGFFIKTIQVEVTFDYTTAETEGVRIFVLPYTDGSLTPNYTSSESPLYPAGQGKGEGDFTIQSKGVTVDQIRFKMTSADKSRVLYEFFISVNYSFIKFPDEIKGTI